MKDVCYALNALLHLGIWGWFVITMMTKGTPWFGVLLFGGIAGVFAFKSWRYCLRVLVEAFEPELLKKSREPRR